MELIDTFHFTATALDSNTGVKIKRHLDNYNELFEFADECRNKGFNMMKVSSFDSEGWRATQLLAYNPVEEKFIAQWKERAERLNVK